MNMRLISIAVVLSFVFGCNASEKSMDERQLNQIDKSEPSLIMDISINGEGRNDIFLTSPDKKISDVNTDTIFSLFSDGTAIYSANDLDASPPYCTFKVSDTQIETLLNTLKAHRVFEGEQWLFHSGPSSDFVQIYINYRGQVFVFSSWHELFADNPKVVDMGYGIVVLEGKDREEFIESRSPEYKEFLRKWNVIRESVKDFIRENQEE